MQRKKPSEIGSLQAASSIAETAKPISADEYNAIICLVRPLGIKLSKLSYALADNIPSGQLVSLANMAEPSLVGDPVSTFDEKYVCDVIHPHIFEVKTTDGKVACSGSCIFIVQLELGIKPPQEFWTMFLARNVKLYTHPALRDLVASLCARSGLVASPISSVSVTQSISKSALP